MSIDMFRNAMYYFAMRNIENEEKTEKLCDDFSLLDENEQEYIWGILQALLFVKLRTEKANLLDEK
jgi:hypothetical protein